MDFAGQLTACLKRSENIEALAFARYSIDEVNPGVEPGRRRR